MNEQMPGLLVLFFFCDAKGYILGAIQVTSRKDIIVKACGAEIVFCKDIFQVIMGKRMDPKPVYIYFSNIFNNGMLVQQYLFIFIIKRFSKGKIGFVSPETLCRNLPRL